MNKVHTARAIKDTWYVLKYVYYWYSKSFKNETPLVFSILGAEALFQPEALLGEAGRGLCGVQELVCRAVGRCPAHTHDVLFSSVVLARQATEPFSRAPLRARASALNAAGPPRVTLSPP